MRFTIKNHGVNWIASTVSMPVASVKRCRVRSCLAFALTGRLITTVKTSSLHRMLCLMGHGKKRMSSSSVREIVTHRVPTRILTSMRSGGKMAF